MKLKTRFILLMIAIFICFMLITWLLSVQLLSKVNLQWGKKLSERQVMLDKHRTLAPLIREITLARKMAVEPAIIDMALHEHEYKLDPAMRLRGLAVMEKYRFNFRDQSYFAAFAQSGNYYFNDATNQYAGKRLRYVLSPTEKKDQWFYATLADDKEYQISLDTNVALNVTKAWINVLIRSGNETLGVIGTGIDLSDLIKETVNDTQPGLANLFIDKSMAIQLHSDPKLIDHMTIAKDVEQRIKVDVLLTNPDDIEQLRQAMLALERAPAEQATLWVSYEGKKRLMGVAYLPEIGWYSLTLMEEHSLNLFDGMFIGPLLFGFVLLLVLLTVSWALRSWILQPIEALRVSADKIGRGNFEIAPPLQGADEIAHLSQSFTRMAVWVHNSNQELEEKVRVRTIELIEEVAERKRAEEALRESEYALAITINTALDAVVQMDAAGSITRWNNQAEAIFGWTRVEAIGRLLHETIIPPHYREAHILGLKHFLVSGEGPILNKRIELEGQHRDGHMFSIEMSITPLKIADKYEFSAFIRNITERNQAETELLRGVIMGDQDKSGGS